VVNLLLNPLLIPLLVAGVVVLAELLHLRRVRRVAYLAFGPRGRPAYWVFTVPFLRAAALASIAWALLQLWSYDPLGTQFIRDDKLVTKRLLIALDGSPSMYLPDAGPAMPRHTRMRQARLALQSILDRVDMTDTRITLVVFYTTARPMLIDTIDKDLVLNMLDDLPLHTAFDAGQTNAIAGVNAALELAKPFPRKSATLLVLSDGDVNTPMSPQPKPSSIADVMVLGFGDTNRTYQIYTHASRQDAASLKLLATRLGGSYFDSNTRLPPLTFANNFSKIVPPELRPWSTREYALLALTLGSCVLALLHPALAMLGRPRKSRNPATINPLSFSHASQPQSSHNGVLS
jgi:Ca-activated chloride channel homolog